MNVEQYKEQLNNLTTEIKSDYLFSEKVAQKIVSKANVDHNSSFSKMVSMRGNYFDEGESYVREPIFFRSYRSYL